MPHEAFVIRYRSDVLGSGRNVFAFRNGFDANLVKNNMYPDVRISNVNKKVYLLEKKKKMELVVPPVRVESVDFESFYHKTRINGLELNLVEFVIDDHAKLLIVSSSAMPELDELELKDVKYNIEQLFKK